MYNRKYFFVIAILLLTVQSVVGQNNTNSPYTRFGYGELTEGTATELRGMGGVSLANRSKNTINVVNPASYSSVDSMTFMFDVAGSALFTRFSDMDNGNNTLNANLDYLTIRFPLAKWLGFSAGVLPYSYAGYNFYQSDTLEIPRESEEPDKEPFTRMFYGTGGLSQLYGGLSANILNHVSLGVNAYYMFGEVSNVRSLSYSSTTIPSSAGYSRINVSDFRFRYGLQAYNTFAGKHDVTLGLIYEHKTALNGRFSSQLGTDSASTFELPQVMGIGLSYTFNKQLTVGVDYTRQNWGDALFFNKTDSLVNSSKLAIGAEYIPDPTGRKYSDRIRYRIGFNTGNPYYKVNNLLQPNDFSVSFGVGLPTRAGRSWMNASLEYGKRGTRTFLREDYLKLTFSASINENWFFKPKL